jgi:hypothetical protein
VVQSNVLSLPLSMVVSMRDGMKGVVWSEVVELFEGRGPGGRCCGWSTTQPRSEDGRVPVWERDCARRVSRSKLARSGALGLFRPP